MKSDQPVTDFDQTVCTATGPAASKRRGLSVPLRIDSPIAVAEGCQPITIGVPFPKARVKEPYAAVVRDHEGRTVPLQVCPLARWSDGSIKWLLVDFLSPRLSAGTSEMVLRVTPGTAPSAGDRGIAVQELRDAVLVDTGTTTFEIDRSGSCLLRRVRG